MSQKNILGYTYNQKIKLAIIVATVAILAVTGLIIYNSTKPKINNTTNTNNNTTETNQSSEKKSTESEIKKSNEQDFKAPEAPQPPNVELPKPNN